MKAYLVQDRFDGSSTIWCYVLADNANKAKYRATHYDESQTIADNRLFPTELKVRRISELDGDGITIADLRNADQLGWAECAGCGRELRYLDSDELVPGITSDGNIYCSEECLATHPRQPYRPQHGICLYAG